jgi:hypothetical protein
MIENDSIAGTGLANARIPLGLNRSARIAQGHAVLDSVSQRIEALEQGRASDGFIQLLGVPHETRLEFEGDEIARYARDHGLEPEEVRISVGLARLNDRLDYPDTAELLDAVVSGTLRLTRSDLGTLSVLADDDLVGEVRRRLADQI